MPSFCSRLGAIVSSVGLLTVTDSRVSSPLAVVPWGALVAAVVVVAGRLASLRRARQTELKRAFLATLELLTANLEALDDTTPGHGVRVAAHSVGIARALGMRADQIDAIRVAALFHEMRPGDSRLAALVQQIPTSAAAALAASVRNAFGLLAEYRRYSELVGSEQPADQLRLPLGAKVLAVADAFETLQGATDVRRPMSVWAALEEIERGTGTTFATSVVRALRRSVTPGRTLPMKALAV